MPYDALLLGTSANDGTGDPLRTAGGKINAMLAELYASAQHVQARTLYVDGTNGSDGTGAVGREDKPYQTLAGARTAAAAGSLIIVRPGTYTPSTNLWKDGVDYYFQAGALVDVVNPAYDFNLFSDGGVAGTCRVFGEGKFTMRNTNGNPFSVYGMKVTHASSSGILICDEFLQTSVGNASSSTEGGIYGAFAGNNYSRVRRAVGYHYAYYWESGPYTCDGDYAEAPGGTVGSNVIGAPNGEFYSNITELVGSDDRLNGIPIFMQSVDASAAMWVRASIVRGRGGITPISILVIGGKCYVTCQKMFGGIETRTGDGFAATEIWLNSEKVQPSSAGPLINITDGDDWGTAALVNTRVSKWDMAGVADVDFGAIAGSGSLLVMEGGRMIGNGSTTGLVASGSASLELSDLRLDTNANASTNPLILSGGVVNVRLDGVRLFSAATHSIVSDTPQSIAALASGANKPFDSNITLATDSDHFGFPAASYPSFNAQTGTTYTLALSDHSKVVTLDNASDITITVPPYSEVPFPSGSQILFVQRGTGAVTFSEGSGVTIYSADGDMKLRAQYSSASLIKLATNEWLLVGDITT